MVIHPRGPVRTPTEAPAERAQDEPPLHDLTHCPEVRRSTKATKKPDRYNGRAKMALVSSGPSILWHEHLKYGEPMSLPGKTSGRLQ